MNDAIRIQSFTAQGKLRGTAKTLDCIAQDIDAHIEALEAEVERLTNKLNTDSQNFQIECQTAEIQTLRIQIEAVNNAVNNLINNSEGVAGLHLNGDVAPWEDLLEGGQYEEWLLPLAALDAEKEEA